MGMRRRPGAHRPSARLFAHDRALGVRRVAGADEAGRGCLAGPLVVAAVCLDLEGLGPAARRALGDLDDSKRLTPGRAGAGRAGDPAPRRAGRRRQRVVRDDRPRRPPPHQPEAAGARAGGDHALPVPLPGRRLRAGPLGSRAPSGGRGGPHQRLHRRGVRRGQDDPRPADARPDGHGLSGLRLRAPHGLRDARPPRRPRGGGACPRFTAARSGRPRIRGDGAPGSAGARRAR